MELDKYEELLKLLTEEIEIDGKKYLLKEEFDKFYIKSNKASGTRIRKIMQLIRKSAEDIRFDIQDKKKKI